MEANIDHLNGILVILLQMNAMQNLLFKRMIKTYQTELLEFIILVHMLDKLFKDLL
jgi:hypothetical protein